MPIFSCATKWCSRLVNLNSHAHNLGHVSSRKSIADREPQEQEVEEVGQETSLVRKMNCFAALGRSVVALKCDRGTHDIGMLYMTGH